jgi:MYXO-CTERM domain-containing protein
MRAHRSSFAHLAVVVLSCSSLVAAACGTPEPETDVAASENALVESFAARSLVIPMGTNYQNNGTLRAFGLVYALLRGGVTVKWTILTGKAVGATDFQILAPATVTNRETGAAVATPVTYRGGSFVVDGSQRAAALPIIDAWLASDTVTVVHDVTGTFSADVSRTLTAAPRIGVFQDGNEAIAFTDLNAAGVTDSSGAAWSATSGDLLTDVAIVGPTTTSTTDGALFRADGSPNYCHVTSMHWQPTTAAAIARVPGVVSEVRSWLDSSRATHAFMECHALLTFENDVNGRFLTTTGVRVDEPPAGVPLVVSLVDSPFNQFDGTLTADTGSVQSIAPLAGGAFQPFTRTLIAGPAAVLWATGRLNGDPNNGQLTYLGGHNYSTTTPITTNPMTNGVRLLLNSLFESDCASPVGGPDISIVASAPATSASTTITFTLVYTNAGAGYADSAVLRDALPAGATFVSASGGGTLVGSEVVWNLGNLAPGATGTVTFTVTVPGDGTYTNSGTMAFLQALTPRTATSNTTTTVVATVPPDTTIVTAEPSPTTDTTGDFTFSATLAGSTFACSVDGGAYAACPATYSTPALADGSHTLSVRATAPAALGGMTDPTPATATWIVDTTAPDTTIVTAEPSPTNDPTGDFTFSSPDATATFECSVDGGAYAACPATYSTGTLADGSHTLSVRAVDAAGNVDATPATATWTVTTSTTVAIDAPVSGSTTTSPTPPISGTGVGGATVVVTVDGTEVGTTTVAADGTWSVTPATALAAGSHTAVATATDLAGNTATDTTTFTVASGMFVNILAPAAGGSITDSTPTISGTGQPGATVSVTVDGTSVGTTTVAADGTWSVTPSTPLTEGAHSVVATSTGAGGDTATDTSDFTVDSTTAVAFLQPGDAGPIGDVTPELSGTAEPGDTVEVTVDGTVVGTVTADAEGNWTLGLTTALTDGAHAVSVVGTDAAGNTATDTGSFTVDATQPALEIRAPGDNTHTSDTTPTVSGDTEPGLLVIVLIDDSMVGTVVADALGHWSLDLTTPLTPGARQVHATTTDAAGNTADDTHGFTIDTTAPSVDQTGPADGSATPDTTPAISGTAEPGSSVEVFVDGVLIGTVTAASDGSWSVPTTTPLEDGTHTVRAVASDDAGNTATDSGSFTVDTATTVAITGPADGSSTGSLRPLLVGTAEPGAAVEVTIDGVVVGTVTAGADGAWTFTPTTDLAAGPHTITVHATDEVGNTADASATFTVDLAILDTDGDGILDVDECPSTPCRDTDLDGTPDFQDPDDDGDGLPTAVECIGGVPCPDHDSDGLPDYLDPDDDNDGIPTSEEAPGGVPRDTDSDGIPDHLDVDDDGDGLLTTAECSTPAACVDHDGDGLPDFIDPDDDNDGISTARERADGEIFGDDVDNDGIVDWLDVESDGDGVLDADEGLGDVDGDGIPNYLDPLAELPDGGVLDGGVVDGGPGDAGPADGGPRADAGVGPHPPGGVSGGACNCSMPGTSAPGTGSGAGAALSLFGLALVLARRRRRAIAVAALSGLVALLSFAGVASAQGIALDQFRPAETSGDGFAISRPNDLGHLHLGAQLVLDYAHNPLVYEEVAGDASTQSERIVEHQLIGTVGLAFGLADRVVIYAGLPVSLFSEGSAGPGFSSADGTAVGDPYLGVRVRLFGEARDAFALGVQLAGTAPLADAVQADQLFTGERGFTFLPRLMGEVRLADERLRLGLNVGARFRRSSQVVDLTVGNELTYGVGITGVVVPHALDLLLELYGATGFDELFSRSASPLELLGGARIQPTCGFTIGAAVGSGLARGYGSPNFRGVFSLGFAPDATCNAAAEAVVEDVVEPATPGDQDHDGLNDLVDACPTAPEDVDTFQDADGCPDPDNDGDNVLDVDDGAPLVPEDLDGFEDTDGVPDPDNDHDSVLDADDGCPNEPEDVDTFEDANGCPDPDNDGDTVLDVDDQCPLTPGTVAAHGCSESVRLDTATGTIFILQRVEFATNRDVILDRSFPLLLEVAAVLRANPQLTGIRIEGHTDDRGRDAANLELSRRRAASVRRWLVEHELEAGRLEAWGCGELHPAQPNSTANGRQANRRVEFHIVRPAPAGGARQLEGCVQAP